MAWEDLAFLIGDWSGESAPGGSGPADGSGAFSFHEELGGAVLVRRNRADYPASAGQEARHHEDLMVIYRGSAGIRAHYWDSEGHYIEYDISIPVTDRVAQFLSRPDVPGPAFRLRYEADGADNLAGRFEMRAPGAAEFATYLRWTSVRQRPGRS